MGQISIAVEKNNGNSNIKQRSELQNEFLPLGAYRNNSEICYWSRNLFLGTGLKTFHLCFEQEAVKDSPIIRELLESKFPKQIPQWCRVGI